MFRKLTLIAMIAMATGCTKSSDKISPQGTLSDYVSRSFGLKSPGDKSRLLELTTGQVRTALEGLDDASFKASFIDTKKEFVSLKIRDERKLAEDQYSITYEVTYKHSSGDSKDKITNKKHALFVNEGGKWLITEVRNLKTFIEHQNEMSIDL